MIQLDRRQVVFEAADDVNTLKQGRICEEQEKKVCPSEETRGKAMLLWKRKILKLKKIILKSTFGKNTFNIIV